MKRLEALEHTGEDHEIFYRRILRAARQCRELEVVTLNTLGLYHDTLDAELMFHVVLSRSHALTLAPIPQAMHNAMLNWYVANLDRYPVPFRVDRE